MATITYDAGGNISSDRYVDITSTVGGASAFSTRQLTPRLFTTSSSFPTNAVVEFDSASSVLSFLNQDSTADEYLQSVPLFGYVSKAGRKCNKVEIMRWADTDTSAEVFGSEAGSLSDLITYTSEDLDVTLDGTTYTATGIDLSAASAYADVATALQTAVQALGSPLDNTTFTFNSASGGFDVSTNGTADGALSFASDTSGFLADLGLGSTAVFSTGIAAQSVETLLDKSIELTNDFGGFAFVHEIDSDTVEDVAIWNNGQNYKFMFIERATANEVSDYYTNLGSYAGTGIVAYDEDVTDEYPWLHPLAELGAINPEKASAFPNFMFGKSDYNSALVTTDDDADFYDQYRANYFGRTQEAGSTVTWFQRGYLMGGSDDATDMSVYAAEMWLKSDLKSSFMSMFDALSGITADTKGKATINSYIKSSIDSALFNSAISVGKDLTTTQKAYITQVTGDDSAYLDVANIGYWYDVDFTTETNTSGVTEYYAEYTLIYAKADKIRKVEGTHLLI